MAEPINKLRRRPWVQEVTGLSRSSIYGYISKNLFPKPVKLGPRAVAWREADVIAWLESRKTKVEQPEAGDQRQQAKREA